MARPGVHPFWVDKIRVLVATEPGMSGVEVRRRLLNRELLKDEPTPPTPVPSDRAIRRIMERFKELPRAQQQPYTVFSWPESMESGALPWDASRVALDLLRDNYAIVGSQKSVNPLVREVRWLWRVTQAIPDAPLDRRVSLAGLLHTIENFLAPGLLGLPENRPQAMAVFQWVMAFQPWRSPEDKEAYDGLPENLKKLPPPLEELFFGARQEPSKEDK